MAGTTSGKSAAAAELAIVSAAPPGSMGFDVSAGGTGIVDVVTWAKLLWA